MGKGKVKGIDVSMGGKEVCLTLRWQFFLRQVNAPVKNYCAHGNRRGGRGQQLAADGAAY